MKIINFIILLFTFLSFPLCKKIEFDKGINPILTGWENSPEKLSSLHCKSCHKEEHKNWINSIHAKSWTNKRFKKAFEQENFDWCIHCHSPLKAQKEEIKKNLKITYSLASEGINCVTCHVRDGKIYNSSWNFNSSHLVYKSKDFGSPEFCAGCHQFNFPLIQSSKIHYSNEPMQNTYIEWKNSSNSKTCKNCHWENHFLKGPHDLEWMKELFTKINFEKLNPEIISISIGLKKIRAHKFPSGDLFRSVVIQVSDNSKFNNILFEKRFSRFYKKGIHSGSRIWNKDLESDTSIEPEKEEISITLDYNSKNTPYIRVLYYYHDPILGGENGLDDNYLILRTYP
ncbi:MAG: hypothetical protein KDK36_02635 [Leptospiraceae bacterium]|nr:hypothetical protein [Leptospiraceae bacterium]